MRMEDGLRLLGSARGVVANRGIARSRLRYGELRRGLLHFLGKTFPSAARGADDQVMREGRALRAQVADHRRALDRCDNGLGAAMIGAIDKVLLAQHRGAWNDDRADLQRADVCRLPNRNPWQ